MGRFQKGYPRFASRKFPSAKDVQKPRTDDLKGSEIDRWKIDRSISPRMKILVNSHSIARKLRHHAKSDGWKTTCLLKWSFFTPYVSFRRCNSRMFTGFPSGRCENSPNISLSKQTSLFVQTVDLYCTTVTICYIYSFSKGMDCAIQKLTLLGDQNISTYWPTYTE